ncbi:MAG: hypothetical protein H6667_18430 [Ardenticatenaceae bacterium]|nr:hypothetical protein [Ardenticatenaceae bacterium]MCB9445751.1 hypothetical protein [Ardenticatenaceae bacterium]
MTTKSKPHADSQFNVPILTTKLYIPPVRENVVERPFLLQKLHNGSQQPGGFTLISGPAGFGKTTLLSEFVSQRQQRAAWLSLDEGDNDPARFWTYLISACQTVLADVGQTVLELLSTAQSLPHETIPTLLINDLAAHKYAITLILDDYHEIQNTVVHNGLLFLLEHLPPNLHIIIATRIDPPWPLGRFRARNQLNEIRAQDLRFNTAESAEFLHRTMALNLSAENAAALETRTEGWIAGLQLAGLSLQGRSDVTAFIEAFTGSHTYIADYLLAEILQKQTEEIQSFLLQTSILERMNARLCTAVTQNPASPTLLANLHRANIFIVPLDDEGRWFRYHHLFADLLQARLSQTLPIDAISRLHTQAAVWYEQNGLTREAIRHALAAQDFEHVASLVEQEARGLMFSGQANALSKWLAALPEASFLAHPRLRVYRLWLDLMQEKADLSPQALQEKETLLRTLPPSPENEQLQMELMAVLWRFLAFAGNTNRAIQLAEEALARLSENEMALRARAYSALAVAHWMEGSAAKARQAYDHCMRLTKTSDNTSLAAHATMMMAMSEIDYGQLHQAARTYQSIIDRVEQAGQKTVFPAGQGYVGLAGIHLEWNELETAVTYLQKGMTLCRQGGLGLTIGRTIKARLHQARGEFQAAIDELERLGETGVEPTGTARQILLRLAMNDLDEAARLAKPWLNLLGGESPPLYTPVLVWEIIQVTLARLLMAQGELDQAWQLLESVEETAVPGNRISRLIEVSLLKALIFQKRNQGHATPEALPYLEHALELAEPEGFMMLFLEVGEVIGGLLTAVNHHPTAASQAKNYARKLLIAFNKGQPAASQSDVLIEQLTPREMEVLAFLALGDSNQTIAEKLFITVRTVKKHITGILGKLGVSNRTQAAARARELGLIASD